MKTNNVFWELLIVLGLVYLFMELEVVRLLKARGAQ